MESDSSEDDVLDCSSSKFDPLAAIYSPLMKLPVPNAPLMDNVEKFVSVYEGKCKGQNVQSKKVKLPDVKLQRQFLAEQMPVENKRKSKNIWSYMEKQTAGPMSVLNLCVKENKKVKVYTRGINFIRGYCYGFLIAFDKHWNLALVDVDEVFTRRRNRKTPALGGGSCMRDDGDRDKETVGESLVRVVSRTKRKEICERHVPQVMLRGEHVALVVASDSHSLI